ncbi:hypothetical protein ACJX0J_029650, partial [Zea mays]
KNLNKDNENIITSLFDSQIHILIIEGNISLGKSVRLSCIYEVNINLKLIVNKPKKLEVLKIWGHVLSIFSDWVLHKCIENLLDIDPVRDILILISAATDRTHITDITYINNYIFSLTIDTQIHATMLKILNLFLNLGPNLVSLYLWVLHDWGDADCIKILKNCKKAIPSRDAGGKCP